MSGFLSVLVSYGATVVKAAYQKIIASDTASQAGANFGSAVALSGDGNYIVVGSSLAGSADDGAVYVYYSNNGTWEEQAKLVASNAVAGDWFGCAVDITKNGDRIIIGAQHANALPYNQDNSGAAYIFQRTGTSWTEELYLSGGDGGTNDYFGSSVAINDDGTAIFVGAYGDDTGSTSSVGYIHTYIRNGSSWAGLDWKADAEDLPTTATEGSAYHGWTVACNADGTRCIEGGPGDNNQGKTNCGVVTIHHRTLGVAGWKHVTNSAWSAFMKTYAVWYGSGNTTRTISVSVDFPTTDAYTFSYQADNTITWDIDGGSPVSFSGYTTILPTTVLNLSEGTHILNISIDDAGGSGYGGAMTIADSVGNIIWTTLELVTTAWVKDIWLEPPYASTNGQFGWSVAMDGAGDRVVIGAVGESPTGITSAGAVYVYQRTGTVWSLVQQLVASDPADGDKFGYSVSINATGDKITVGAIYANLPTKNTAGAAYVFERSGATWSQSLKLTADDAVIGDNLGSAIALNDAGTGVVVGSLNNDPLGSIDSGAAYYFPLTVTPPYVPVDPYWNDVVLLITADNGAQGSKIFVDLSKNNIGLTSHLAVVTDTSIKKFGSGSIAFPTAGYLITPTTSILDFTDALMTIEAWVYPTAVSIPHSCIVMNPNSTSGKGWELQMEDTTRRLTFQYNFGVSGKFLSGPVLNLNTWNHVAVTYDGSTIRLYADGVLGNSITTQLNMGTGGIRIGWHADTGSGSAADFRGYMDEIRITKGVARYTGTTYTVPTTSFYI